MGLNDSKKSDLEMKSALSTHLKGKGHNFSLNNVEIIGNESNFLKGSSKNVSKYNKLLIKLQADLENFENIYKLIFIL